MTPVYDVQGFCEAHHITRGFFYKLLKEGKGPRLMKVGRRTLITAESGADWRKQMENATNGQTIDDMLDGLEGV